MELVVTMDIALLIPPAGRSAAQPSSSALSETGQGQQPTQSGAFAALLENAVKRTEEEQIPPLSDTDDPIDVALSTAGDDHATGAALIGIALASLSPAPDLHAVVSPVTDKAESLPDSTERNLQNSESIPLLSQGLIVAAPHDDDTLGHESAPADLAQPRTSDASIKSLLQPVLDHDQLSETPARQEDSRTNSVPVIQNGRSVSGDLASLPLGQPSGDSALPGMRPPGTLISDGEVSPVMENQGRKDLLSTAYRNGNVQFLDRPSTMIQEQGAQVITLLGQPLSVRVIGDSEGGGQDSFGAFAQGEGTGAFFQSGTNGASESLMRGNLPLFFNEQFTSALQAQPSPQGAGTSVATPAAAHLKLTQAFLGENHSATMTSASGMAQTIHVELPSHDSGPLSVRISMTDQTVHTQFTTDRSDLGAFLLTRQDQLQQNLGKSGLELGQFQVHINQEGRQEAFPDRQPRHNGGASEQQMASQDHNRQAQDQERPNHRPTHALSLFA